MVRAYKTWLIVFLLLVTNGCSNEDDTSSTETIPSTSNVTCSEGQVAVGVAVRSGEFIDKLTLLCATYPESKIIDTASAVTGASVGGTGGTARNSFTCTSGALRSIVGKNGRPVSSTELASFSVSCTDGGGSSDYYNYREDGKENFFYSCGDTELATGFTVKSSPYAQVGNITGITCRAR